MSSQSCKFKVKRPHSPDFIGIQNYKKQRLIEDLENLTIGDSSSLKSRRHWQKGSSSPICEPDPIVEGIYMPQATRLQALAFSRSDSKDDHSVLYSRIKELIRNEALQLIKWFDAPKTVYSQWLRWFQKRSLPTVNEWVTNDYTDNLSNLLHQDFEGDIDMDT